MYVGLRIDVSLVQSKEEKKPKTHECRHIMKTYKSFCWKDESKELKQAGRKNNSTLFFFAILNTKLLSHYCTSSFSEAITDAIFISINRLVDVQGKLINFSLMSGVTPKD